MPDAHQGELPFYDSPEDATYSAILKSHKPIKEVACALFNTLKPDSAYARLVGALKESRPEKLTTADHVFIANYCEQYDWLYYVEAQCHHAGTHRVEPEDERAALMREFIASVTRQERIAVRLGLELTQDRS